MKMYFAGAETPDFAGLLRQHGVESCLQSAFYLKYKTQPNDLKFQNYLLDSGGYTARKKGVTIPVRQYVDFINRFNVPVAFNLDTADVAETLENQRVLDENTSCQILPVYHYSDWADPKHRGLLETYAARYSWIGLGGTAEGRTGRTGRTEKMKFLDWVFKTTRGKVKFHGLAVTSPRLMLEYPFYSVDSTTWLSSGKFGTYVKFEKGKLVRHVSPRAQLAQGRSMANGRMKLSHPAQVDFQCVDFQVNSIRAFLAMERHVTDVWKKRGIAWSS